MILSGSKGVQSQGLVFPESKFEVTYLDNYCERFLEMQARQVGDQSKAADQLSSRSRISGGIGKESARNGHAQHLPFPKKEILNDYRIAHQSRLASLLGRREVLTGKAKFGIFGDGKEVPQIAMARAFKFGDWRSGYYRDQTFMFATGTSTIQEFFAQLYAHPDVVAEPASAGRMMNGHFATRSLNDDGSWKDLTKIKNSSADISPTSGQMPRLVGLAYASKLFRELPDLKNFTTFSHNGDEVAFGTIGNASTSEGLFFEAMNAGGVLKVPMVVSVWDDGYGISVPNKYQTCKDSISNVLSGMEIDENGDGYLIYKVNGWDYPSLCKAYLEGVERARKEHIPVFLHITELTQPQGHSTSGSHERYKSKERLQWEQDHDCIKLMREWMIAAGIATGQELDRMETENKTIVDAAKERAWQEYLAPIKNEIAEVGVLIRDIAVTSSDSDTITKLVDDLEALKEPLRRNTFGAVDNVLRLTRANASEVRSRLVEWQKVEKGRNRERYSSHVYSESSEAALKVQPVAATYDENASKVDGRQVLQTCFDAALARDPRVFAIGEDIGTIGDVNLAFEGLQAKHGMLRVTDTGIREATIIGQAIGAAMRGLRPIAEIQYIDYLLFALQTLSDDLATLQWRTKGGQKAPVIVRTRGHRLEGVWHSGSPMGMILSTLRGMCILVPRNMTQAAGFYNTMLASDDAALIVEVLSGYRLKEVIPSNVGEFKVPVGIPEVLRSGNDITLVTYGACCRVAMEAARELESLGISLDVIDVQSLLPFDIHHSIVESLKKTNRIIILDEDVPGGASSFILREVLEVQDGYRFLDSKPVTITGKDHRPAYGSDGDYFSKPQAEDVIEAALELMHEFDLTSY